MDQQLTFDLQTDPSSTHCVVVCKNEVPVARSNPNSWVGAALTRRALVTLLQRSPRCFTVWEEDPRSTGWFGLNPYSQQGADVYALFIEKVDATP